MTRVALTLGADLSPGDVLVVGLSRLTDRRIASIERVSPQGRLARLEPGDGPCDAMLVDAQTYRTVAEGEDRCR